MNTSQRTRIDDISQIGEELGDDQLRLAAGATDVNPLTSPAVAPTYTDGWRIDGTCTDPVLPGSGPEISL
jgi:hypothetical protein